ncbi:MAG: hemolysin family protein [Planctomycetota bacterium]
MAESTGHIVLMLVLLAGSAFFSGAETAFFNLSRRQIKQLKTSAHKLQSLAGKLLTKPSQLLGCLLLGNMIVNVLFFAMGSILTVRVRENVGLTAAAVTGVLTFVILVLFGEILPKSLAYANSRSISIGAAVPAYLCVQIFRPFLFVFRFFIVEPVLRLFLGPTNVVKPVTSSEFKTLIEQVRKRGLISADENKLLTEIVELGFLKVRHVMQPRVDMVACAVGDPVDKVREIMQKNHLTKLPVYVRRIDNIVGLVHMRQLLLRPATSLDKLVQKAHFVPEQKTVESLLEFFRNAGTDIAIVVDEYGGIAGSVQLEDIAEELLGPMEFASGMEPVESIGPFRYRLAGDLAVHDWAEVFGIQPDDTRASTIGGLVTALLGKIPRSGDVAYWKNLKFTVERVRKHRIESLILTLEPIPANGQ